MSKPISAFLGVNNLQPSDKLNIVRGTTNYKVAFSVVSESLTLQSTVTTQGNIFNGNSQLVQTESDGKLPAIDGSQLLNIPGGGASLRVINNVTADNYPGGGASLRVINNVTADNYTVQASDLGKLIVFNNPGGNPVTLTIPAGLDVGFNFDVLHRKTSALITFVGSGGTTIYTASGTSPEVQIFDTLTSFVSFDTDEHLATSIYLEIPAP
jgi:hypothetical protein